MRLQARKIRLHSRKYDVGHCGQVLQHNYGDKEAMLDSRLSLLIRLLV